MQDESALQDQRGKETTGGPTGLEQAFAAPQDPLGDPGPGERSGLSSRIAEELLDGGAEVIGADTVGTDPNGSETPGADTSGADTAAPPVLRAVEIDDPARAVGDDPANPIHGSTAAEFERR
ncbi:hypothetical protein SAMN06295885_0242 [Rathayibacter oskolensis]|uniref:Uncharacterized protein n=1 Tax=Rathayibacter oskolensis TaxID=1891671 RepID=A0A1X7MVH8_9MICO|nr:hypothetical protein [Rathayibacter oskolensis]SMH28871.1 hypothetical protein SAMN06295885_0242 [Rathayibacter oskolensis]